MSALLIVVAALICGALCTQAARKLFLYAYTGRFGHGFEAAIATGLAILGFAIVLAHMAVHVAGGLA